MNCSRKQRTSRFAALAALLLTACAAPRDQVTRFRGAEQSVNIFTIGSVTASPYVYQPAAEAFTMRRTVMLAPAPASPSGSDRTRCVYVSLLARSETFWDGQRIGRSGHAGAPGPLDNFYVIPAASANAGPHRLEIRVAHPEPDFFQGVVIGDYERMLRSRIVGQVVPLSGFAVFVVIGIYYVTLSFASRRRGATRTFALLCFAAALLAVAETWRWTVGYTYDVQPLRLAIITALTFCVSLLLPAFFALELELRHARLWLASMAAILGIVAAGTPSPDECCLRLFSASMIVSALVLVVAARRQKRRTIPGAIALTILIAALVRNGFSFSDNAFFIAFCGAIACLLVSMAIELRRERREHASLEIELLRKTIEPHFVMNTLTAVIEWMEQEPAAGVHFLEAFAGELRLFSKIAHDAAIPLRDEIALCRSHLAVMGCRKAKRFHLRTGEVDLAATIPPAVLHTLVENALTHNRYRGDDVEFVLAVERRNGSRRYVFDAPLGDAKTSVGPDGTGLRYVKARLEERYPGKWSLSTGRKGAHWRTTIEVPA